MNNLTHGRKIEGARVEREETMIKQARMKKEEHRTGRRKMRFSVRINSFMITLTVVVLAGCSAKRQRLQSSDATIRADLIGTWVARMTNTFGVTFDNDVTYEGNGVVRWRGSLTERDGTRREFDDTGLWHIKDGYLFTCVTNSTFRSLANEPEYRDQLLSVTATNFTYRDEYDRVYTITRKR